MEYGQGNVLESLFNKIAGFQDCWKTYLLPSHSRLYFSSGKNLKQLHQRSIKYVLLKNVKHYVHRGIYGRLIFYFLVYRLFYLKSSIRGQNKNKNKILFQQLFFSILDFGCWREKIRSSQQRCSVKKWSLKFCKIHRKILVPCEPSYRTPPVAASENSNFIVLLLFDSTKNTAPTKTNTYYRFLFI